MPSSSVTESGSATHKQVSSTTVGDGGRLIWLDIVRFLCALMILGIHWLRACFKLGMFGQAGVSLVVGYQSQTIGPRMLPHVLIAGTGRLLSVWLTNSIGLFGGFGWEGVNALIIVSGFSLTVSLKNRDLTGAAWLTWLKKRAVRILIPFYIVAIPFLVGYVVLLALLPHVHAAMAASLDGKLHSVLQTPLLGVILSHTVLFDPYNRQWQPDFFAPAWWFIPAILAAYAVYPAIRGCVRRLGPTLVLTLSAVVTMVAYLLADAGVLVNESWYFIVLQESFNLTLGVVLGTVWLDTSRRSQFERFAFGRTSSLLALLMFIAGNLANWSPYTRFFASMLYGPGLVIMIAAIAKALERTRVARLAAAIDAYDLYLVHQPFAFPVALMAKMTLHGFGVFFGWFAFVAIASFATRVLAFVQQRIACCIRSTSPRWFVTSNVRRKAERIQP